jgi:thiamine transport system ATP-binding protein
MLKVESLTACFGEHKFRWSFQLAEGAFMAITGESGVGKSTLLNCLLGFQPVASGHISWQGQNLNSLGVFQRPFGVLFQKDNLFEHLTVEKNLSFGLNPSSRLTEAQRDALEVAADRFDITSLLNRRAYALSGGQQQRVALARVFLQNKPVLLLDEPFSSLDPDLRQAGIQWVKELQQDQNTTILMVTHHFSEIRPYVNTIIEGVSSVEWKQYPAR